MPKSLELQLEKIWKDVLGIVKVSISPATFSTWFSHTFLVSLKEVDAERNFAEIGCHSSFVADTIERRYFGLVQDALNTVVEKKNDITFLVRQKPTKQNENTTPLFTPQEMKTDSSVERSLRHSRISEGFTFENFAVSTTNQMAHAAADAVSKNPGKAYNPLLFWGGVGVGKTHLMLAIGYRVLQKNPEAKVLYCMGEEFTSEIIEAIRNKTTPSFRRRYRDLDLLLLDDVQFLAGKNAVQEEFFHTFNVLKRRGGQIVLTSDRPPQEIEKFEERLRSRFEAGLIIDISPPDFELRTAISLIKARERGLELPMEVAQVIAANIDSTRRIEGFLNRLFSETLRKDSPLTVELVTNLLGKQNGDKQNYKKPAQPQEVVSAVAQHFSLGKRKLLGPNRSKPIAAPRQILMYLLRVELGLPLQEVGRLVGGRDHTTVMHAVEKISANLSTDQKMRQDIMGIKSSIHNHPF